MEQIIKDYNKALENLNKAIQKAIIRIILNNSPELTYDKIIKLFNNDGNKKAITIDNRSIELNTNYIMTFNQYNGDDKNTLVTIMQKDGNGFLGTYLIESSIVETMVVKSKETLQLESNNGLCKVVMYGGSETALQPHDSLTGQIQLGTPWGAWKNVYTVNTYTSDGVYANESTRNVRSNISPLEIIDNLEFTNKSRSDKIQLNVTNLLNTSIVQKDEGCENIFINESELLKVALMEIKHLKEEVNKLKGE